MFEHGNLSELVDLSGDMERAAIVDLTCESGPRKLTAGQIDANMSAVASYLVDRGYVSGDVIGILSENCSEYLVCAGGIVRAGLVVVPINHKLSQETIEFVCADANVRAVFASSELTPRCPDGVEVFPIEADWIMNSANVEPFTPKCPVTDQIARILYTSGSTGRPKGVELSHDSQVYVLKKLLGLNMGFMRGKTVAIAAPLFHMNGLVFSEYTLAGGGTIVLHKRFQVHEFIKAIERYKINLISGVPTMLAMMARETKLISATDLSSVEHIMIGSAPLSVAVLKETSYMFPNALVLNGYGTTETGGSIFGAHPNGLERPPLSIGHPTSGTMVRLVDGDSDDEGVLEIKGPANMVAYKNLPDLTAERLKDGWYRTGDVMRRDKNNFYYVVGREDDMFVCNGENIFPGEIEKLLERHAGVQQSCALGIDDKIRGKIPVAFVVKASEAELDVDTLKSFALENAPAYMHPRQIWFSQTLPLAATGKIDRKELEQRAMQLMKEE